MKKRILWFVVSGMSTLSMSQDLKPVSATGAAEVDVMPTVADEFNTEFEEQKKIDWDSNTNNSMNDDFTEVTIRDIVEPKVDYRYAAFDVPDPFVPPVVDPSGQSKEADVVNALSRYKVSNLQVVGIWELSPGIRKAFIKSSNGREGVSIEVGDPIGSEGGEVVNIESDHVRIREFRLTEDGTRQFRDTIKRLGASTLDQLGSSSSSDENPPEESDTGFTSDNTQNNSSFESDSSPQENNIQQPLVPQNGVPLAPESQPANPVPVNQEETNSSGIISI